MLRNWKKSDWSESPSLRQMKTKTLVYACDHNQEYFEYTKASFASFCDHHDLADWRIIFADVGLHPRQSAELARFGEVVKYKPCHRMHDGFFSPVAAAKLKIVADFTDDAHVLMSLDSDTLVFENLDTLVSGFVQSGKPVGIFFEEIEEFNRVPAVWGWREFKIPDEFVNQNNWRNSPMANAGVLLTRGNEARELGMVGTSFFEEYEAQLGLGEQGIINAMLYDCEIPCFRLAVKYNCLAWEQHIVHAGAGRPYVGTRPYFRGETVAIRHFAAPEGKGPLRAALPALDSNRALLRFRDGNIQDDPVRPSKNRRGHS